jgi:hypothetical protein
VRQDVEIGEFFHLLDASSWLLVPKECSAVDAPVRRGAKAGSDHVLGVDLTGAYEGSIGRQC